MDETLQLQRFLRAAAVAPASINAEARTVEVVWTTGAEVVRRPFLDEPYIEELGLEEGQVRLERLNGGAPLLDSHDAYSLESQIGVVLSARLVGRANAREGRAVVQFARDDERADAVWRKVSQGVVRNVSVGYRVHRFEEVAASEKGLRRLIATDWEPLELSFVPIGADAKAQARSDTNDNAHPCRVRWLQEQRTMDETTITQGAAPASATPQPAPAPTPTRASPPADPAPDPTPATPAAPARATEADVRRQERLRATSIRTAVRAARLPDDFADELIGGELDLTAARAAIVERLERDQAPTRTTPTQVTVGDDDRTRVRSAVESAMQHRMGVAAANLPQGASRELHDRPVLRLMEELIESRGERARNLTTEQVIERSFMSTSDFPLLLQSSAQRTLRDQYQAAPRTFLPWTRQQDFKDFRPETSVAMSGMTQLEELPEGGTIKMARLGEAGETGVVRTFARTLGFTRQAAYNDDLEGFRRTLGIAGAAAPRVESNLVYFLLTSNVVLADGVALFHATHGNLGTGAGSAMGEAGIDLMIQKMMVQKALASATGVASEGAADDGDYLNLQPRHLIVAPAQLTAARKVTTSTTPVASADVNPWANQFKSLNGEARLAAGAPKWYGAADPSEINTIRWGYLRGNAGVMVKLHDNLQGRLGVYYDVVHDFGTYVEDYRGLYRGDGA